MPAIITDDTTNPVVVPDTATTSTPFAEISVADTPGATETVSVQLTPSYSYYYGNASEPIGTLSDPDGGGSFNPSTGIFTETAISTGTPTAATQILDRLVFTPPNEPNGHAAQSMATISVTDGTTPAVVDPTPVTIDTVTPPNITGDVANQPDANETPIRPFATTQITDQNFLFGPNYASGPQTATITLTDGGTPTDADGLLTGTGLSKTGVGTYTLTSPYSVGYSLGDLTFTPSAVAAGQTRTTDFGLSVTDVKAGTTGSSNDTSVLVFGPAPIGAPLITGTQANQQLSAGNSTLPFSNVTLGDTSASPVTESATLTVNVNGAPSDVDGTFGTLNGLTKTGVGTYSLITESPAALTNTLDNVGFSSSSSAAGSSVGITITVTDSQTPAQSATDSTTSLNIVTPNSGGDTGGGGVVITTGGDSGITNPTTGTLATTGGSSTGTTNTATTTVTTTETTPPGPPTTPPTTPPGVPPTTPPAPAPNPIPSPPDNGLQATPATSTEQAEITQATMSGQQQGAAEMTFIDLGHVGGDFGAIGNAGASGAAGTALQPFDNQLFSDMKALLSDWNAASPDIINGVETPGGPAVTMPAQFVLNIVTDGIDTIQGTPGPADAAFGGAIQQYAQIDSNFLLLHHS